MVSLNQIPFQPQAQRLYHTPEAQRLAVLHHIATMRQHATTVARLLWLYDLGRARGGEVQL